jgi:hypothetical protein
MTLPVGTYRVKYGSPGYQDSKEHVIQIAQSTDVQDRIILDKLAPPPMQAGNKPQGSVAPAPAPQAQPQPVTPAPAAPAMLKGKMEASATSIERGQSVTLSWQVENASSIAITELGSVAPQGSRTVYPSKSTVYQLTANGSPLAEQSIDVREKPQQAAPAPAPVLVAQAPQQPTGPDRATLEKALGAYVSLFQRASGKSGKDCQGIFNGSYQGTLHGFAGWCSSARSFEVSEQCSQVSGTPEAPTLTCAETAVIHPKDGDPQPVHSQKIFHFTRSSDGNWQISSW